MASGKKKGGRVTPKGTGSKPAPEPAPLPQVGKRPARPGLLLLTAVMWIGCGIVALIALSASWKLIPGIAFIGVGIFYLRAAGTAYLRQSGQ